MKSTQVHEDRHTNWHNIRPTTFKPTSTHFFFRFWHEQLKYGDHFFTWRKTIKKIRRKKKREGLRWYGNVAAAPCQRKYVANNFQRVATDNFANHATCNDLFWFYSFVLFCVLRSPRVREWQQPPNATLPVNFSAWCRMARHRCRAAKPLESLDAASHEAQASELCIKKFRLIISFFFGDRNKRRSFN